MLLMEEILFDQRFVFAPHKTITKTKPKQISDKFLSQSCHLFLGETKRTCL